MRICAHPQSGHIVLQFVNGRLQLSDIGFLFLQCAHTNRQRLYTLGRIVSLFAQQTLFGSQLGRIEFKLRYLTFNVRNRFIEFILNAFNVFQQFQHGAMQMIQTGHLSAHIKIGIGQTFLFRFQIMQPIADVMVLQFIDLPFHRLLGNIQIVQLLTNVALMAHTMIGFGFNVITATAIASMSLQIEVEKGRINSKCQQTK